MSKLDKIEREASGLPLADLRRLSIWIDGQISLRESEEDSQPHHSAHEIVTSKTSGAITYKQEKVKCGKKTCKCKTGAGHGPYWYKYWNEGGRTRSSYIGKELPEKIANELALSESNDGANSNKDKRAIGKRKRRGKSHKSWTRTIQN